MDLKNNQVRKLAVAGLFYPSNQKELENSVRLYLSKAAAQISTNCEFSPKAIIVPHAGYQYSGLTAAAAYNSIKPIAEKINQVIIMGPCHRVGISGMALPSCTAFDTPIGRVSVNLSAISDALSFHQVRIFDETHRDDHAIEVHLPFLQVLLKEFSIVPFIVGQTSTIEVAEVLQALWGGDETLILISSDLSHYLPYSDAQKLDDSTRIAIELLDPMALGEAQACGHNSIKGLMMVAREKGLSATTLDIRNSGDTAGDKEKVVGYGSWLLGGSNDKSSFMNISNSVKDPSEEIIETYGEMMLTVAAKSILDTLTKTQPIDIELQAFPQELQEIGASFVTIQKNGKLRGCIGSIQPVYPLIKDIAYNASNAAFQDTRFSKLSAEELSKNHVSISISVLGPMEPLNFVSEADLIEQLRPGVDGLVLSEEQNRGVFLPSVWQGIPEPQEFLNQLKLKAGITKDHWSWKIKAWRYITSSISSDDLPQHLNLWPQI